MVRKIKSVIRLTKTRQPNKIFNSGLMTMRPNCCTGVPCNKVRIRSTNAAALMRLRGVIRSFMVFFMVVLAFFLGISWFRFSIRVSVFDPAVIAWLFGLGFRFRLRVVVSGFDLAAWDFGFGSGFRFQFVVSVSVRGFGLGSWFRFSIRDFRIPCRGFTILCCGFF